MVNTRDWNDPLGDLRDYYEERAAIMEYDGHLPRYEAEKRAYEETLRKRRQMKR